MVIRHAKYAQKSSWSRCPQHMARLTSHCTGTLASRWACILLSCCYLHFSCMVCLKTCCLHHAADMQLQSTTDMLPCSMLLLNMHATFTCSCIELHILATHQKFRPATLKANNCHLISRHHHNMPTVSWSVCFAAHHSKHSKWLFTSSHTSHYMRVSTSHAADRWWRF